MKTETQIKRLKRLIAKAELDILRIVSDETPCRDAAKELETVQNQLASYEHALHLLTD